jgi:hypothetical protein
MTSRPGTDTFDALAIVPLTDSCLDEALLTDARVTPSTESPCKRPDTRCICRIFTHARTNVDVLFDDRLLDVRVAESHHGELWKYSSAPHSIPIALEYRRMSHGSSDGNGRGLSSYDRTCLPKGKLIESIGTLVFVRVYL